MGSGKTNTRGRPIVGLKGQGSGKKKKIKKTCAAQADYKTSTERGEQKESNLRRMSKTGQKARCCEEVRRGK